MHKVIIHIYEYQLFVVENGLYDQSPYSYTRTFKYKYNIHVYQSHSNFYMKQALLF